MISEEDIQKVVRAFYIDVRQDDLLAPVFATKINDDDWDRHMDHIADFWSSIFLKTGRFKGNPMIKHAAIPDITPEHFQRWLSLFHQTARRLLEPEKAEIFDTMARRIATSLQMGLAFNFEKLGRQDHPFKDYGLRRSHAAR